MNDPQSNILNFIVVSDNGNTIEIKDHHGNSIALNANGITIRSAIGINIIADGKLNIQSSQDLNMAGLNVVAAGDIGFTAKANATAELSAAGQTTVKGAMVMIN